MAGLGVVWVKNIRQAKDRGGVLSRL